MQRHHSSELKLALLRIASSSGEEADEGDDAILNEAMQARFHLHKDCTGHCTWLVGIKVSWRRQERTISSRLPLLTWAGIRLTSLRSKYFSSSVSLRINKHLPPPQLMSNCSSCCMSHVHESRVVAPPEFWHKLHCHRDWRSRVEALSSERFCFASVQLSGYRVTMASCLAAFGGLRIGRAESSGLPIFQSVEVAEWIFDARIVDVASGV